MTDSPFRFIMLLPVAYLIGQIIALVLSNTPCPDWICPPMNYDIDIRTATGSRVLSL